ncbi:MAG: autotransporter domain-containing protein [Proteobacteria bacterium]|nr:autotransporter domain-containing protein [Pseudomonadota bacterium]
MKKNLFHFFSFLGFLLGTSLLNGDTASRSFQNHLATYLDYRSNLRNHLHNDITKSAPTQKKEELPTSNIWSSFGYGKTKDTSSEGYGSSRSYSPSIGVDTLYGDWTVGLTFSGAHSNSKSFLTPPGQTVSNSAVLQPYASYKLQDWVSLFGAAGIIYTDGKTINQSTPSNGHQLTRNYVATFGSVFILPIIRSAA